MGNSRTKLLDSPGVVLVAVAVTLSALAGFAWFKLEGRTPPGTDCSRITGQLRIRIAASAPPERSAMDAWAEIDAKLAQLRDACPADEASSFIDGDFQQWASRQAGPTQTTIIAPSPDSVAPVGSTTVPTQP